jgi:uncharacterized protein YjbI with pentapeptide repeats
VLDLSRETVEGRTSTRERLVGADLSEATLTRVVFQDCDLSGAELDAAMPDTCAFLGCRLERVRLFGSTLRGCKLTGSTFLRAELRPLTAEGVDWQDVRIGLAQAVLLARARGAVVDG